MTKEKAKHLAEIFNAYAEGKTIEVFLEGEWGEIPPDGWNFNIEKETYRIKKEQKYRPFRNAKECFNEMKKHQPFGWLKDKDSELRNIQALTEKMSTIADGVYLHGINLINGWHVFEEAVKEYTFADGEPFGINIEEE